MSTADRSSQTMRIDIQPDFHEQMKGISKAHFVTVYESPETNLPAKTERKHKGADYEKLLQSIYDGVVVTDANGVVLDYNARALTLFDEENDITGTNILDRIPGAGEQLMETIRQNLSDNRHTVVDAACFKSDGSIFPTEIAVNSITMDDATQMCFFIRDITVRKKQQHALEEAVAQLEEHDRARMQFVSNVSHELRTPLTSMIYAVANMLKGVTGPLPDRVRKYLEMMDGDCNRLLGTVNDILDMRKIDNKTLSLSKTCFPLAPLVHRATESLRLQADQKSIELKTNLGSENWFVNCDPHKIERVILNIVGNAVKFTKEKGVIDVTMEDDPEHKGFVRFSVRDDGIGIPENMIEHVTKRYFTVGDQAIGSGLGLALSKEIIEMHGGGMGIASPPPGFDNGTLVAMILPITEGPMVLAVDDEDLITDLLNKQISQKGYHVHSANSGEAALTSVQNLVPDVVIMDLSMPDLSGAEVIRKMKKEKKLMRIPIIVLTGASIVGDDLELLNKFAIPAMSKPWKEEELLARIEEAFLGKAAMNANIV